MKCKFSKLYFLFFISPVFLNAFTIKEKGIRYRLKPLFLTKKNYSSKVLDSSLPQKSIEEGLWALSVLSPPSLSDLKTKFYVSSRKSQVFTLKKLFDDEITWLKIPKSDDRLAALLNCPHKNEVILILKGTEMLPVKTGCRLRRLMAD